MIPAEVVRMILPKDRAGRRDATQFSTVGVSDMISLHALHVKRYKEVEIIILTAVNSNVESRGDDTALVQSTVELDNDLAASVVIDDFEFTNVTWSKRCSVCRCGNSSR
jgi:hypothetical protein